MNRVIQLLSFVLILSVSAIASAYDVAMMPVSGVNLKPGQADAITALLAQQYSTASGRNVVAGDAVRRVLRDANHPAAAKALGTAEYVQGNCVGLDTKLMLTASRHDQQGGVIYAASMTATSMDDMPEVTQRLARALATRTPPLETRTIDNVTRTEAEPINQTQTVIPKGIKSSVVLPIASGVTYEPMASLGFDLRVESRDHFFDFGVGLMLPTGGGGDDKRAYGSGYAELSGNYFLSSGSFGPYLGLGVSPRLQFHESEDNGGVGVAPFAQIGAMFPRESRSRAVFELRVAQNIFPFGESTDHYGSGADRPAKSPTELSVQFGFVF